MPKIKPGAKLANSAGAKDAKVEIRRNVAAALAGPAHVFEAFAGAGSLYRQTWRTLAATYVGCDLRYFADGRKVFVADNRRVLRAIDLAPFNLFDLDAYGDPWTQAIIIAARRKVLPGERVGMVVTEAGMQYRNGVVSHALNNLTGLRHHTVPGAAMSVQRAEVQMLIWEELARRMGARIERFWKANARTGSAMCYMGVVLIGEVEAASHRDGELAIQLPVEHAAALAVPI